MVNLQILFFFDISAVVLMMTLASLSKRLGDALKIRAYYKVLYATSLVVIGTSATDMIADSVNLDTNLLISIGVRFVAAAVAVLVCLRYWNWLFAEFFKE